jgi:hypothetical protein
VHIDGQLRKEVRLGLIDGFPQLNELRIFVEETLGEPLQNITMANDMQAVAFDLIGWARARGRLTELVMAASADRPGNTKLIKLAERFRFVPAEAGENERIVLKSVPFQNVGQWVEKMARCRRAVARFEPQPPPDDSGYGSGFLVAPDIFMTNYHVVKDLPADEPGTAVVRFDYEIDAKGTEAVGRQCRLAQRQPLAASPEDQLDFALMKLADRPSDDTLTDGSKRGFLKPAARSARSAPRAHLEGTHGKPPEPAVAGMRCPPGEMAPAGCCRFELGGAGWPSRDGAWARASGIGQPRLRGLIPAAGKPQGSPQAVRLSRLFPVDAEANQFVEGLQGAS